jgi:hypothetical protein
MVAALAFAAGVGLDRSLAFEPPFHGWEAAMAGAAPVNVTAEPVAISGGDLSGLELRGAWVLRGDHRGFGAFSGLLITGGRLVAVADTGGWLGASLTWHGDTLQLINARMAPMRDGDGNAYTKSGGDAEGLTRLGARLVVSFERDHRLMFLDDRGRMGGAVRSPMFEQLRSNKSLEALATLPDGRLIAFAEGAGNEGAPMFVIDAVGRVTEGRLPLAGIHSVTGADVGPDGRLYLVLRAYSPLFGVSIRVMRYALGPDSLPLPGSAETLAAFEADSGIDNMEGIALERGPDSDIRLWLISDDNLSVSQRTLLMRFDVAP